MNIDFSEIFAFGMTILSHVKPVKRLGRASVLKLCYPTIPHDSFESSSILPRGDFGPAPRNGGEQMMHNASFESGADMLLVLPCCAIGACAGVTGLRRKPR